MTERLPLAGSDLDRQRVLDRLHTRRIGRALTIVDETDSTNDDARLALTRGAPSGVVIVADHQRQGRGSRGRVWQSPAGTDLYVSIADRPTLAPSILPTLTLAVGLALADTIDTVVQAPHRVAIKWPNDLWIDRKKCCGILVEAVATGAQIDGVVIGIGLNVNREQWPEELREQATSLAQATSTRHDRSEVLASLLQHVEARVDALVAAGPSAIVSLVDARLAMRGERVRCEDVSGVLMGVAQTGALRIDTGAGIRDVIAGTLTRA